MRLSVILCRKDISHQSFIITFSDSFTLQLWKLWNFIGWFIKCPNFSTNYLLSTEGIILSYPFIPFRFLIYYNVNVAPDFHVKMILTAGLKYWMNELTNRITLTSLIDDIFFSSIFSRISIINWFLRLIVMFYADIIKHLLFIYLVPIHTCLQLTTKIITPKSSTSITRVSILDILIMSVRLSVYVCVYLCVSKDLAHRWTDMVLLNSEASQERLITFFGEHITTLPS